MGGFKKQNEGLCGKGKLVLIGGLTESLEQCQRSTQPVGGLIKPWDELGIGSGA